jgi:hypothetical protein
MADDDETTPREEASAEEQANEHVKAFFLALAAKGKDEWNKWRRDPANERERATFAGVDFSKAPLDTIDFSGFEFGHWVDFSGCVWRGVAWQFGGDWERGYGFGIRFDPKAFRPGRPSFIGATFGSSARFINATFGEEAFFDGAIFDAHPSFFGATFGDGASFTKTTFGSWTSFCLATFGACARFDGTTFGGYATFNGAAFGYLANFNSALFKGGVTFIAGPGPNPNEEKVDPENSLKQRHRRLWKHRGSGPDRFQSISFANARFNSDIEISGAANFSGRTFDDVVDFSNARFFKPPIFHNVTNVVQINFSGTRIGFALPGKRPWTFDSKIPIGLRALRKIAEETKNHDLERDLYIEERKAERGVYWRQFLQELKEASMTEKPRVLGRLLTHCLWIVVLFGYGALADYGRRFERPLAWLVLSVFIFHSGYASILSPLRQKVDPANKDYYDQAVWMLALGNAVPFVGHLSIDAGIKKSLYCPCDVCGERAPIPPLAIQVLVIVQNVVSIALIFFFGLALRNYFKIK